MRQIIVIIFLSFFISACDLMELIDESSEDTDGSTLTFTDNQGNEVITRCGNNAGASQVVSYDVGSPDPVVEQDSNEILGLPDYSDGSNRAVSLGCFGSITLRYSQDFTDLEGDDIYFFEAGIVESISVEISVDGSEWLEYGSLSGGASALDLSGVADSDTGYRYIRVSDNGQLCSNDTPGADLDAVVLLNCI